MLLGLVVLVAVVVFWFAVRSRELFVLSVRDGRVLALKGRLPAGFLGDVRSIVARPPVRWATIRAVKGEHHARLTVTGDIDEGRAQRLRNAFGLRPMAQLRAAPIVDRPTMGHLLGIAWLAWLLDRR